MNRATSGPTLLIGVGNIVEVARQGGTRYVVAEIFGGPDGPYARLIRKRPDGTYNAFVRPLEGLVQRPFSVFKEGETVRVNSIPEEGEFIAVEDGVARVAMSGWSKPLEGGDNLAIPPAEARISFWSLVLENRLNHKEPEVDE